MAISLPSNIIGISKSAAFEVVNGRAQHGGKLWARKTDKILTLGMDGQLHEDLEVKLSFIAVSQINDWQLKTDEKVAYGAGFMRTLTHENRNKKEDENLNDEVIQYAEVAIEAAISVPNAASVDQMQIDNVWNIKIKQGELLMIVEIQPSQIGMDLRLLLIVNHDLVKAIFDFISIFTSKRFTRVT